MSDRILTPAELTRRHVRAGARIFSEGEAADVAYVVERGEVDILTWQDGALARVATVSSGQLIGEMAILDAAPRSATAVARSDAELIVIERDRLEARLTTLDPVVRLALSGLIDRLRAQIHRGAGEATPSAAQRAESAAAIDRLRLENELEATLLGGGLALYLQPIHELRTRAVHGYEGLCRWPHPTRGMVSPERFIPLAEQSGLIVALGRWVLRESCRVAALLGRVPGQDPELFVSVNVSTTQFHDRGFLLALESALRESGIAPRRLKLEITESALSQPEAARRFIGACKELGVRMSLDDFGTGYSGLAILHDLAFDELKVDQRFVRQALLDPRSARVAEAILYLARGLGLDTVCEGVESEDQLEHMRALGCRYGQGYLFSPPLPWQEVLERAVLEQATLGPQAAAR